MELVYNLALVSLVGVAFYLALQPRYLFMVRIQNGLVRLAKGKLTRVSLEEIEQVCREGQIARGWIGGRKRGRRVVLAFSRTIPSSYQQRLRNLWTLP
jgi:hypothetical protein